MVRDGLGLAIGAFEEHYGAARNVNHSVLGVSRRSLTSRAVCGHDHLPLIGGRQAIDQRELELHRFFSTVEQQEQAGGFDPITLGIHFVDGIARHAESERGDCRIVPVFFGEFGTIGFDPAQVLEPGGLMRLTPEESPAPEDCLTAADFRQS